MRITTRKTEGWNSMVISFVPETPEEIQQLDKLFGFKGECDPISIFESDDPSKSKGPSGEISGHENQRWIILY